MSVSTEAIDETYEVRGREVTLEYNPETHQVAVSAPGLEQEFTSAQQDAQKTLESLGVFTRVADIVDIDGDELTVTLKPAASVELRDTPENNKRLLKRPISKQFDGSTISKRRGKYGYHATVGVDDIQSIGLAHRDRAAVYPSVENGFLALRVVPEDSPHSMVVRTDTTGLLRIPNSLGAAVDLDGHGVKWQIELDDFSASDVTLGDASHDQLAEFADFLGVLEDEGGDESVSVDDLVEAIESRGFSESDISEFIDEGGSLPGITGSLYGVTTCELDEFSYTSADADEGEFTTITHVGQDELEHEGDSWSQEHFKSYLRREQVEELGWGPDDYIDIHLGRFGDDELALRLDGEVRPHYIDVDEDGDLKMAPCVRKLYKMGNDQLNFYFPNALAHALDVSDKQVFWVVSDGDLYGRIDHRP